MEGFEMDHAYLVETITNTLGRTNREFATLANTPNDRIKVNALIGLVGELSGELAYVRSELLPAKKKSRNPFKR
jgi:hypothetical protein